MPNMTVRNIPEADYSVLGGTPGATAAASTRKF